MKVFSIVQLCVMPSMKTYSIHSWEIQSTLFIIYTSAENNEIARF